MDNIDRAILIALENNARATASEISKKVNLSIPAVSERIRKLEASGILEKSTIRMNRKKMGYGLMAFIFINIEHEKYIDGARQAIGAFSEVIECHHMAGEYDYLLKVLLEDTDELDHFISHKLKKVNGIVKSNTLITLSTIKDELNRNEVHS